MNFTLQPNGTVSTWKTPEGADIIFPEQEMMYGSVVKTVGGVQVCCPNFGDAPEGLNLPQDGLVRLHKTGRPKIESETTISRLFEFVKPWKHSARVRITEAENFIYLNHALLHTLHLTNTDPKATIPYSLGLRIYLATHQEPFRIQYGSLSMAGSQLPEQSGRCFDIKGKVPIALQLERGTMEVRMGLYDDFYIWTDQPDLYICIEPILKGREEKRPILKYNEKVIASCAISYRPKEDS